MSFEQELAQIISTHAQLEQQTIQELLEVPPELALGDYALPCFALAKQLKKNPAQIAQELAKEIQADFLERTEAKGPYLNFYLKRAAVAKRVLTKTTISAPKNKKIVFEFPSPNTNKPLHLGHLRNMLLGEATARTCAQAGYEVIRTNLNNDRGIHICKSMLAYKKYGDNKTPQDLELKPDHFVGHYYVKYAQEAKENPSLEEEAQEMLRAWEAGDKEVRALWKQMNDWAHEGFAVTYNRLGISFDKEYYEHAFYEDAKKRVQEAHKKGIFSTDENKNIIAPLGEKLGDKVVLRADGTAIYATQDIGLAQLKQEDFKPDNEVYVVAEEQTHYFKQLFAIFDLLGMDHERHHLSYGMISLPSGRMKSREGNVVDCDALLDEVEAVAKEEILNRHKNLSEEELAKRSRVIGHAALRFFMLKYEPKTGFVYDPEESVSFEGETGPYIQYAAARIQSILKEAPVSGEVDYSLLSSEEEYALLRTLRNTLGVVEEAARQYKVHLVARHALKVAQTFTSFYHACRILDAPEDVRDARVALIRKTREHLEKLLDLLGIELLEEM